MKALIAKHQGKVAENIVSEHFDSRTPLELLSSADTVLSARVIEVTPHFSKDESSVVTDYRVIPSRFIKRDPNIDSAVQPGSTRALVIRRKGGTILEGDVRYTTWTTAFPDSEDLANGDEVVLFLSYDPDEKAYFFCSGPYGVFRVRSGEVMPLARGADGRRDRSLGALPAFVEDLQRALLKKH